MATQFAQIETGGFTNANITAPANQWTFASGGNDITLPTPTENTWVGIRARTTVSGTSPIQIDAGGLNIFGVGLGGGALFILLGTPSASIKFVAVNSGGWAWYIVAGQQDTGWLAFTSPGSGVSFTGSLGYDAGIRLLGDQLLFRGGMNTSNVISGSSPWATVPTGVRPSQSVTFLQGALINNGAVISSVTLDASTGHLSATSPTTNGVLNAIFLDGLTASFL